MGRFTLALGYVLTGDTRYLVEYNASFPHSPDPYLQHLKNQQNQAPVSDLVKLCAKAGVAYTKSAKGSQGNSNE